MILGSRGLNGESQRANYKPTFRLTAVTSDASSKCKEEVIQAVKLKPSNRHRSLFYAVVKASVNGVISDVISPFYAVVSDVIEFYAVVERDVIRFYAVVTCDVIQSYAVVKVTADSSTQGRAGFKGVYLPVSLRQLYM